jgi:TPP-dependent pyruvate/acetoin dehydrogenase alpha subunit
LADSSALAQIESTIAAEIKRAVTDALEAPYPEIAEVRQHVYV